MQIKEPFINYNLKVYIDDRCNYKNSRDFINLMFRKYINVNVDDEKIRYGVYGKPYFCSLDYEYSLSHSGKKIAIVISTRNSIGIDLQVMKNSAYLSKLVKDLKNKEKYNERVCGELIWTVKEAYSKYSGNGVMELENITLESLNPPTISIDGIKKKNIVFIWKEITFKHDIYFLTCCFSKKEVRL